MNRVCIEKATGKVIEMQSGGKVERLSWMEWSLSIKDPKDRTEEKYQEYLDKCDALEEMRLNTLKNNAIGYGYSEADIEVKWISDEELQPLMAALNQPTSEQIAAQEKESLIHAKMREIAETALIAEGKLVAEK